MDIIKWIKKNNFKDIDEELSDQIDNLNVLQSEKDKLIKMYDDKLNKVIWSEYEEFYNDEEGDIDDESKGE